MNHKMIWEFGCHFQNPNLAIPMHLHMEGMEDFPAAEYPLILCGCTEVDVDVQWIAPRVAELRHVMSHALFSNNVVFLWET